MSFGFIWRFSANQGHYKSATCEQLTMALAVTIPEHTC
jgi:hypothetical protein